MKKKADNTLSKKVKEAPQSSSHRYFQPLTLQQNLIFPSIMTTFPKKLAE